MRVVVTGGGGDLGSRVVRELDQRGHRAVSASRRTGVDLSTGEGLAEVLGDADAVVHCATNPLKPRAVDVGGARRIVEALRRARRRPHLVAVSIVGCDVSGYPYYRAKVATEGVLRDSGFPATVLRATQFHAFAAFFANLHLGPVGLRLGDMRIQPVDVGLVAQRLAKLTAGPAPDGFVRATDVAGPEAFGMQQLARMIAEHDRRRPPRLLRVRPLGRVMGEFSSGAIVPAGPVDTGGETFLQWLDRQPRPLPHRPRDPLG